MPRWPQEIADAVFFDICFGLKFRVGVRSRLLAIRPMSLSFALDIWRIEVVLTRRRPRTTMGASREEV
jgi:hypothetical protein